ncbi:tetratricopeptide repeat protein [Kiloniella sp. EL199]|uniref:tetratricopeptide repeat protein n=1 Tax=Kiloniella sp. EL199 TaxID=2107581 RepID=UPI0013C47D48|nr:tetratricopeptide repeat protein [Kiloniella sp. EL199]
MILFTSSVFSFENSAKADQKDNRLPVLFNNLLQAPPGPYSIIIENKIWEIWLESADPKITDLMTRASKATQSKKYTEALDQYTKVIQHNPNYAEGWNKRALVNYLIGNYEKSLSDINRTLTLEPRHFGAISGQGLIYSAQKKWTLAKKSFAKALCIHPNMEGPKLNLKILSTQDIEAEI